MTGLESGAMKIFRQLRLALVIAGATAAGLLTSSLHAATGGCDASLERAGSRTARGFGASGLSARVRAARRGWQRKRRGPGQRSRPDPRRVL